MRKWKIMVLVALAVLLLSHSLNAGINSLATIYLLVVVVRFLIRLIVKFRVILLLAALYLLN